MRRLLVGFLLTGLLAGFASLISGCGEADGRYFKSTRHNQPHPFRNRIHNPADYRYETEADRS